MWWGTGWRQASLLCRHEPPETKAGDRASNLWFFWGLSRLVSGAGRIGHNHAPNVGTSRTIESLSHSRAQQPASAAIGLVSVQPPHVSLIDIKVKFENNKALTRRPASFEMAYHFCNSFCHWRLEGNWENVEPQGDHFHYLSFFDGVWIIQSWWDAR